MALSRSIQTIVKEVQENTGFVDDKDALTAEQWSEVFGFGLKKTQRTIKELVRAGKLQPLTIPIRDVTGRKNYTFKYKPVGTQTVDEILQAT